MKSSKKNKIDFIASVDANKKNKVQNLAKLLEADGIEVSQVSSFAGYIVGSANISLEDLQKKYKPRGLDIEPNRDVEIK